MGGALTLLILGVYLGDWTPFRNIEYGTYDLRARLRENTRPSDQIVIVGVDDNSITKVGRWPWPRSVIAQVVENLRSSGAKVIGVDFLFSEPEETEGVKELRRLLTQVDAEANTLLLKLQAHPMALSDKTPVLEVYRAIRQKLSDAVTRMGYDEKLALAITKSPEVVLPLFFELGNPFSLEDQDPPQPILLNAVDHIDNPADLKVFPLLEARKLTPPLSIFQGKSTAMGHINVQPDWDGVIRKELLLLEYRNHFYPSFALRAVASYLNLNPGKEVHITLGSHVTVGAIQIPTDPQMRMWVSFNGPTGTFTTFSVYDVLTSKVPTEAFRDKLVLLGPLATGIADRNVTPVAPAIPGVEVVANVIQNILDQNFISVPRWASATEIGILLLIGGFLMGGMPILGARSAGIVSGVLLVGYVGVATFLFASDGVLISVLHPTLLLVLGYTLVISKRFLVTVKRKDLVEADSIETNKMLGLSFQGQGMLDLAFEKFRKCPLDDGLEELLYNLALDFERKRMLNKAVAVYEYIATVDGGFKDIKERMTKLRAAGETLLRSSGGFMKGSTDSTILVESIGVNPTLGRYEILKELGRGAMGIVYLGRDPKIQRPVAIKTFRLDEVDPTELANVKDRFFREAESAGQLSHPNIVTIYDAGEDHDLAYIAMEVLEGRDLKEWCRQDHLLPLKRVLEIVAKVAEALDYAHTQGIVHRDIKPANLMMLKDGTVKITDFGIARVMASSKTSTGVLLGTPNYMSPEQVNGTKIDGRSDVFSLGVVLFELLTGEKPFQGENVTTLMFQIANQRHEVLAHFRPDLPSECQVIIDRALQKNVDQRYQRGQELARALRQCMQDIPG